MADPFSLIGLGLAALGELTKKGRRERADEQAGNKLDALFPGLTAEGDLPLDQISAGGLFQNQLDAVNAARINGGNSAAFDMALRMKVRTQQQQNFQTQADFSNADLELKIDKFKLDQQTLDFNQDRLAAADLLTANERLRVLASLDNREIAEQLAAEQRARGEAGGNFISIRMPDGGFAVVPEQGTPPHTALVNNLRKETAGLQNINNLVDAFRSGSIQDPQSPIGARQVIDYEFALATLRNRLGTGTPQAAEWARFAERFPDPSSLEQAIRSGDAFAVAGWQRLQEIQVEVTEAAQRDSSLLRMDDQTRGNAMEEIGRARAPVVPQAPFVGQQSVFDPNFQPTGALDPTGEISGGFLGRTTVAGRAGAPTALAFMAAQIADSIGVGDPLQVALLREQMAIAEQAGAPLFGPGAGALGGLGLDVVERVFDPLRGLIGGSP